MSGSRRVRPTKQMPCRECGEPMTVDIAKQNPPRCVECGIAAAASAARQMHERSGPAYARWLASRGVLGRPRSRTTPLDKLLLIVAGQGV